MCVSRRAGERKNGGWITHCDGNIVVVALSPSSLWDVHKRAMTRGGPRKRSDKVEADTQGWARPGMVFPIIVAYGMQALKDTNVIWQNSWVWSHFPGSHATEIHSAFCMV